MYVLFLFQNAVNIGVRTNPSDHNDHEDICHRATVDWTVEHVLVNSCLFSFYYFSPQLSSGEQYTVTQKVKHLENRSDLVSLGMDLPAITYGLCVVNLIWWITYQFYIAIASGV